MTERELVPGLHEALLTADLERRVAALTELAPKVDDLANAEASDRLSRHLAGIVARAIEQTDEAERVEVGTRLIRELIDVVAARRADAVDADADQPRRSRCASLRASAMVLTSCCRPRCSRSRADDRHLEPAVA